MYNANRHQNAGIYSWFDLFARSSYFQVDLVIRTRPDLAILLPLRPHCYYLQNKSIVWSHYKDWLYIMARRLAQVFFFFCAGGNKWDGE